ncbi:MAG: hypothetical protein EB084_02170 [Proteobacteria bacterium]|nr:hypothetical protein [Pseudomonadota bacterium]
MTCVGLYDGSILCKRKGYHVRASYISDVGSLQASTSYTLSGGGMSKAAKAAIVGVVFAVVVFIAVILFG